MRDSALKKVIMRLFKCYWDTRAQMDSRYTNWYIKHCKIRKNKIVFENFAGKGYGENPKYITEEIIKRKLNWDIVWLSNANPDSFPKEVRVIPYDSKKAMRELASARIWVDNIRNSKKPEKKKGQIYLQTWHGLGGVKKVEKAIENELSERYILSAQIDGQNIDGIISGSKFDSALYRRDFWLSGKSEILEYGLPRNDAFYNKENRVHNNQKVRKFFSIPEETGIVLYMPTFRDDGSEAGYITDFHLVRIAFEKRFKKKVVIITRFHPNAEKMQKRFVYSDTLINATNYPDPQELYAAANYLITDYSSAADEFGMLNRPVFRCILDFDKVGYRINKDVLKLQPYPLSFSMSELLHDVSEFGVENYDAFHSNLGFFFSENASAKAVDWLIGKMGKKEV